jgi:glycosyltransferase involved in cell wall biosynthesis
MAIQTDDCELTVLMPCLNEVETLECCIKKAAEFLKSNQINGEILIADNGSTDGSQEIARRNGARVVDIEQKGYGNALIGGTKQALGKYVIMGDADDSYDFLHLMPFVDKLRQGYELVMGNRFRGGISPGAMPPLHRYLGNPVLSFIGRLFYSSDIGDFHCGLRGYNREAMIRLDLQTTGMEYASEMVVQATLHKLKIAEVPTVLAKDGRSRPPHLRSWYDGWRHLRFLLIYSPKWLFLYPGLVLMAVGFVVMLLLAITPIKINTVTFDINTMLYAAVCLIVGIQGVLFSVFTSVYALNSKYIPADSRLISVIEKLTLEKGLMIGMVLSLLGVVVSVIAFHTWKINSFGPLIPSQIMRVTIPAMVLITSGLQILFGSFLIGILSIKHK